MPALDLRPADVELQLFEDNLVSFSIQFDGVNWSARTFSCKVSNTQEATVFTFTCTPSYSAPNTIVAVSSGATTVPNSWNGLWWEFRDETTERTLVTGKLSVTNRRASG